MTTTSIEWTDKSWNPVTGCSKVSPGCAHCYAEDVADRFWKKQYPKINTYLADGNGGFIYRCRDFEDVLTHADRLEQPLHWKKPARIFVNSMSDLFHEDVPDAFIDQVFAVMALAPQHTFQVLTKRAERMRAFTNKLSEIPAERLGTAAFNMQLDEDIDCTLENIIRGYSWWRHMPDRGVPLNGQHRLWPLPNVWLGVSVENQNFLERIDMLKDVPAAVRFVSFEPLLEDLGALILDGIHWCIVGGESGQKARPFNIEWARSIVKQCQSAGVPVFMKQLGSKPNYQRPRVHLAASVSVECEHGYDVCPMCDAGTVPLRDKKGGDPSEWPEDLRVREFPR